MRSRVVLLLNKAVAWLFSPPAAVTLLLVWAAWRSGNPRNRRLVLGALAVLWLFGTPTVPELLLVSLEDRYPAVETGRCAQADAIVVLGGILHMPTSLVQPIEWSESVDRFERGVELWQAGKAPVVVFSGCRAAARGRGCEGEWLREAAVRRGVARNAIVLTAPVENTADEAREAGRLAHAGHWRRILLVTSAFHMPRAMVLFSSTGVEVVPVPVDYRGRGDSSAWTAKVLGFLPQGEGLSESDLALREYFGVAFYRMKMAFERR